MLTRRILLSSVCAVSAGATALPAHAQAVTFTRYSNGTFDRMIAAGGPVFVHVHADWCPTCRAQLSSFNQIGASGFGNAQMVRVDFDADKAFLTEHNVRSQSTILIFRGGREVARLVGQSDRAAIEQALKALSA